MSGPGGGHLPEAPARGVVLVVVLVLLVVIGLTAGVAMRSAITQEKVVNNLRAEFNAQSLAELALRFCEGELQKPGSQRVPALAGADRLPPAQTLADLQWASSSAWAVPTAGPSRGAFHVLDSAGLPGPAGMPAPQCLVERLRLGLGGDVAWVVTVRGFSPDYRPATGAGSGRRPGSGSAVWLQSFLYVDGGP